MYARPFANWTNAHTSSCFGKWLVSRHFSSLLLINQSRHHLKPYRDTPGHTKVVIIEYKGRTCLFKTSMLIKVDHYIILFAYRLITLKYPLPLPYLGVPLFDLLTPEYPLNLASPFTWHLPLPPSSKVYTSLLLPHPQRFTYSLPLSLLPSSLLSSLPSLLLPLPQPSLLIDRTCGSQQSS